MLIKTGITRKRADEPSSACPVCRQAGGRQVVEAGSGFVGRSREREGKCTLGADSLGKSKGPR